ncbi:cinnamoyl-CoA reductase-like SNL6 [Ziziphus jujuba]|uniref:Cinnamoyl-CoA reductase-like SNL6 n=1 Tax=Ziziphus jujuba TaxID=326968 RepID=A0A6P3ZKG6_ZIZJJ|nr:cinnamoyl-CoA reductase-like SNL6 [Ziziphus jujuba]
MGIVKSEERKKAEMEEFRRILVANSGVYRRKDEEYFKGKRFPFTSIDDDDDEQGDKLVCVTSGVSFLGLAIVDRLLTRGYSVRLLVDNPEDIENVREMERGERRMSNDKAISAVMAKLTETESLSEAFNGCRGVFHTSSFVDPAGLSGYTKSMVEIEVKVTENVIKACARTPSVKKCVLTSSLLACIWQDTSHQDISPVINHECWSHESLCIDKKLWYALGKLRSEKAAWKIAEETGLKLVTLCPALITGPQLCCRNPTATIAYLKGAKEMYEKGLLATVDVNRLAEAHVCVFEAMSRTAFGRYICFDKVIEREDDAEKLAQQTNISKSKICEGTESGFIHSGFRLSNTKLSNLMSSTFGRCYSQWHGQYN